jgi:RimJ/RimL family protein N-acetyltransferase
MLDQLPATIQLPEGQLATISQVVEPDAQAVLAYLEAVSGETDYLSFGPGEYGVTPEQQAEIIKSFADPSRGVMLQVRVAGAIAALSSLVRSARRRLQHVGELALTVSQEHWGNGLGRALCRATFAEGKRRGVTRVSLCVRADNARAIRLYENLGFLQEGRLVGSFAVGDALYDEFVMGLRI